MNVAISKFSAYTAVFTLVVVDCVVLVLRSLVAYSEELFKVLLICWFNDRVSY